MINDVIDITQLIQETCYHLKDGETQLYNPYDAWGMDEYYTFKSIREQLEIYEKDPDLLVDPSEILNLRELHKQLEIIRSSIFFAYSEWNKEDFIIDIVERIADLVDYLDKPSDKVDLVESPNFLSFSEIISIEDATHKIITSLGPDPNEWYALGSRKFEEILAEIWRKFGWQTILTPPTKDGGIDVRAIRNSNGVLLCYLIEAKCYNPSRPVGIDVIRSIYGVVERERASQGIIATTSHFTKGAKQESRVLRYRVSLADFEQVYKWIIKYRSLFK